MIASAIVLMTERDSFGPCWAHAFICALLGPFIYLCPVRPIHLSGLCWAHSFGPCWVNWPMLGPFMSILNFSANAVQMKDGELSGPSKFTSWRCTSFCNFCLLLQEIRFPALRRFQLTREGDFVHFLKGFCEFVGIWAWDPGGKCWQGRNSDVGQWGLISFKGN